MASNRSTQRRPLSGLFIARNTFEVLKTRFEPLADDEEYVEVTT
jgi:hypothetical protein